MKFLSARSPQGYHYTERDGVGVYTLTAFSRIPGIDHGFSARSGGVSTGNFTSMNLSFTRVAERVNVRKNYALFCRANGIPLESVVMDTYEHGTTVLRVDSTDCGKGYDRAPLPACDGLVTNDPMVTLFTGHADCMAFYAYDPVKRCIGLAHAGWRGALNRMGCRLIEKLVLEYNSDPKDIIMGVGPSICPSCFEVGDDVADLFTNAYPGVDCRFYNDETKKAHIDLWRIAEAQFMESGVLPEHIHLAGVCTVEDERLFSYRRSKEPTGGMAAYLRLTAL